MRLRVGLVAFEIVYRRIRLDRLPGKPGARYRRVPAEAERRRVEHAVALRIPGFREAATR